MDAQVTKVRPITIAIVALGGEGGGVLADWIVDLAQHGGYLAQTTSVPGVAQRTGATVYYVELFPKAAAQAAGKQPILGLLPMPGDVDLVLASELFEAAIRRGQVGVASSLAAFAAGFEAARAGEAAPPAPSTVSGVTNDVSSPMRELAREAARDYRGEAGTVVTAAVERLNDYQDADYARDFL